MNVGDRVKIGQKNYIVEGNLGRGGYGIVIKAREEHDKRKKMLAIKILFSKTQTDEEKYNLNKNFMVEKVILDVIRNKARPCFSDVLCYDDAFVEGNNYIFITEFVPGITLDKFLDLYDPYPLVPMVKKKVRGQRLFISEKIGIMENLTRGLMNVHSAGVIHRDIKGSNIMIEENSLDITYIDFGLSCLSFPSIHKKFITKQQVFNQQLSEQEIACEGKPGSPVYVAPETVLIGVQTKESDVYSLGIVFHHILAGTPDIYYDIDQINTGDEYLEMLYDDFTGVLLNRIDFTEEFKGQGELNVKEVVKLLEGMLQRNPQVRMTLDTVLEIIPRIKKKERSFERRV